MALTIVTAPAVEPLTIEEVRLHLRLEETEGDIGTLETLIKVARQYVEAETGRALITQTWDWKLDAFPSGDFEVPLPPLQVMGVIGSIKYYNTAGVETTWAATNYSVDTDSEPGRISRLWGELSLNPDYEQRRNRALRGWLWTGGCRAGGHQRGDAGDHSLPLHESWHDYGGLAFIYQDTSLALWEGDVLNVGALNRRIKIETFTTSADAYGEPVKTWAKQVSVWAEILPLSAREQFQAQQVNREVSLRMTIHYRTDLTETMRILYGGDYYDIQGITEIGYREGLELLCGLAKPEGA